MNEIYLFFVGLAAVCVPFLHWLPPRPLSAQDLARQEAEEDRVENWHVPRLLPVLCLVAVCFTYINIGGYYTYIELAAHADGIAKDYMGPLLTWSSIFAIVGCVIALPVLVLVFSSRSSYPWC